MKRAFLIIVALAAIHTIQAQEPATPVVITSTTVSSSMDNHAQVPLSMRTHFETSYPMAANVTWTPVNDWWYASYTDANNRMVRVYYNTQPYFSDKNESFRMALPVQNTYVPEDVITSAINAYGGQLYSITMGKTGDFYVTLIKHGVSEIVAMNSNATALNIPKR